MLQLVLTSLLCSPLSTSQKIKTLHRSLEEHLPTSSSSTAPISRNLDPALHPFARPREYTRAVAAAKLERMFSKPFVDALEGHGDGLYTMTKDESGGLSRIASGSGDGEVRVWDLAQRKSLWNVQGAHRGMVKGVAFSHPAAGEEGRLEKKVGAGEKSLKRKRTALGDKGKGRQGEESDEEDFDYDTTLAKGSSRLLTCGVDKTVKLWDVTGAKGANVKVRFLGLAPSPSSALTFLLSSFSLCKLTPANQASSSFSAFIFSRSLLNLAPLYSSISHHRYDPIFATASTSIDIWEETKTSPLSTLKFHSTSNLSSGEHIVNVAFNKSETSVLASSGSDRTVCLYDLRSGKALGRVSMNVGLYFFALR